MASHKAKGILSKSTEEKIPLLNTDKRVALSIGFKKKATHQTRFDLSNLFVKSPAEETANTPTCQECQPDQGLLQIHDKNSRTYRKMKEETHSPSVQNDRLPTRDSEFDEVFKKKYGEVQVNRRKQKQKEEMEAFNSKQDDFVSKKEDFVSKKEDFVSKKEDFVSKKEDSVQKKEDLSFYGPGYGSTLFNL